jgi:hypothetical protein
MGKSKKFNSGWRKAKRIVINFHKQTPEILIFLSILSNLIENRKKKTKDCLKTNEKSRNYNARFN